MGAKGIAVQVKPAANDEHAREEARFFARAPRPLLALLAAIVLVLLACFAVTREPYYLAQAVVVGVVAWLAVQGSRVAALFLGVLFAFGALVAARETASLASLDALEATIGALFTVLLAGGALYVLFSPGMLRLAVRAQGVRWRWRQRLSDRA